MRVTNLNPDSDIGASGWLVEIEGRRLLMDAGIHPKREGRQALPLFDQVKNQDVDAIAISHCHHDHVGALPVALRHWPKAHVLLTELSYFLAGRVLHNSVNVMKRQREELGVQDYPLFSHDEVDDIEALFQGFRYNRAIEWAAFHRVRAGFSSPTVEFFDAGHALGAAGLLVRGSRESLFYTGDVAFHDQTLLRGARFGEAEADVLIMETTRGTRQTPPGYSRAGEVERFAAALQNALKRKAAVLIPTFALGRTQEVLALLALLIQAGKLKSQPIYIGGLGRVFTEIYDLQARRTHRQHGNLLLHEALNLVVLDQRQAREMRLSGGRIFVLTSGMMNEGTASHDLALRMIGEERHAIFLAGYADPNTPAGRLKASQPGDTFVFSAGGGAVTRRCEVLDFDLTAHAERRDLLGFVGEFSPRVVILAHGDDAARQWFARHIAQRHPKIKVLQPGPGQTVEA